MSLWDRLVHLHQVGEWGFLVAFYGVLVGLIVFICLQLMLVRGRRLALRALTAVRRLMEDIKGLEQQLDELERRVERRLDSRATDLDARMTRKIDQKGDLIQQRIEQQGSTLVDSVSKLDARVSRANEEVERFRERVAEVESRIPGLFDRLDDFRATLASTFQAELGSVLNSFDNSISGILEQMKSELQMGIGRIESIEGMIRSRERAERTLLGTGAEPALPEGLADEQEFEEWEQEAKQLAESEEVESGREDLAESAEPQAEPEVEEYPAEMGRTGGEEAGPDDLETELYPEELEPPEPESDEGEPEEQ